MPTSTTPLRRIMIIGPGGAGKSTLARRLGERLALPVAHLDRLYWRAGWVATPAAEWTRVVADLAAREHWVMDGNYGGTMDLRVALADTIVFLDLPRRVCLARVLRRALRYRGRTRPDMAPGCDEHLTLEFLRWIWTYPRARRPKVLRLLASVAADKRVERLRSAAEVDAFVASLPERG